MRRLFAFGCSFTQYWRWPTWADAMGREREFFQNWGVCGGGNSLIFNSLIECHQRNRICQDDDVYIMWTNTSREDRYVGNRWLAQGNVYWAAGNALPKEYVDKYACERGYLIRDLATITAARYFLEHTGCRWRFMSMVPLAQTNRDTHLGFNPNDQVGEDHDVRALYQDTLRLIAPSVFEVTFGHNWNSRPGLPDSHDHKRRDFHPTPQEHVEYIEHVYGDVRLSPETHAWMQEMQQRVANGENTWREIYKPRERL